MKRILNITMLLASFVILAVGCKKHTIIEPDPNPIDTILRVGNIYCEDGRVIDPYNYKKAGMTNAAGVIFWVNDSLDVEDKAYLVSLSDAYSGHSGGKCIWSDTLISTGVSTSITAMNGAANTSVLTSFQNKNGGYFEAKERALQYGWGINSWYLPSAAQLVELYRNKETVLAALECCNGDGFEQVWYWTSTEDNDGTESKKYNAYIVSLVEGYIQAELKTNLHMVRPIKTIK